MMTNIENAQIAKPKAKKAKTDINKWINKAIVSGKMAMRNA